MTSPDSPVPVRSPSFYLFRSNSSIPPPHSPINHESVLHEVIPHLARRIIRRVTSVVLPIVLLPFHFFFLFLSIITTIMAALFLSWRGFLVYLEIAMNTVEQVYSDFAVGGNKLGKRRRDLLRKVVIDREEAVRQEQIRPRPRGRGMTIA